MEGLKLEQELKTIQNMQAMLLQLVYARDGKIISLTEIIENARPPPHKVAQPDLNTKLSERQEFKDLAYKLWNEEITEEQWRTAMRELAGRKPEEKTSGTEAVEDKEEVE